MKAFPFSLYSFVQCFGVVWVVEVLRVDLGIEVEQFAVAAAAQVVDEVAHEVGNALSTQCVAVAFLEEVMYDRRVVAAG